MRERNHKIFFAIFFRNLLCSTFIVSQSEACLSFVPMMAFLKFQNIKIKFCEVIKSCSTDYNREPTNYVDQLFIQLFFADNLKPFLLCEMKSFISVRYGSIFHNLFVWIRTHSHCRLNVASTSF